MSNEQNESLDGCFPTTQWTLILAVIQGNDEAAATDALNRFCACYRPAIYNFLRRRGLGKEQAEDLTQSFFTSRILEKWDDRKTFLHGADRTKAKKFRCFLCQVLWRFYQDEWRAALSGKAGGKVAHVSVSDPEFQEEPVEESYDGFGRELDRALALEIIRKAAMRSTHSEYHLAHFRREITQAQAAKELGMNENNFKQAHHRFRRRLVHGIREEVSKLADPGEIEEEMRYLMSLFKEGGK